MRGFLILITWLLINSFISCEGKQKHLQEKEFLKKEQVSDSSTNKLKRTTQDTKQQQYTITESNAVSFFTEYGKKNTETRVLIATNFGNIEIELYKDTPIHRANFIYLVKQQYFDGTFFHRVVPNFIIQGGDSDNISTNKKRKKIGHNYRLPAELKNGRKHSYGTISGAKEYRKNPDKKSAPFEFFIFLGPKKHTHHLNGNYTIFAKVVKGMNTVEKIANLPTDKGEWPIENVYITATIIK